MAETGAVRASGDSLPSGGQGSEKPPTTARGVLEAMVKAYQTASQYADTGELRFYMRRGREVLVDDKVDFAVSFHRPNRLRMEVYQIKLVCDGKQLRAAIQDLHGQVLELPAPAELTLKDLQQDAILAEVLTGGIAGPPPQPLLLLEKNALPRILPQGVEAELIEPGDLGEHPCYRVQIRQPEGIQILWVDKKEFLLRRIEYPTQMLAAQFPQDAKPDEILLVADFHSATFQPPKDPKAFVFEVPPDAKLVKYFIPPDPRTLPDPVQLLNKQVPDFKFTDLSGKPVTPKDLAGKVVYLDFWGPQCAPCRQMLPQLEKVFQKYKENPQVVFLAVSVAPPTVENKQLEQIFGELKVTVPMVRDLEGQGSQLFMIPGIPASFLIGKDGRVQDYQIGLPPNLETELPAKIEKLLAGQDIYQQALAPFQERVRQYEAALQRAMEGKPPEGIFQQQMEIPPAKIEPKSEPTGFRLQPLWKSQQCIQPGNILVVDRPDGSLRILVVDGFKRVCEFSPDGKLLHTYDLGLQPQEAVTFLITGVGGDGRRLFGALAPGQQRVHLFNDQFQELFRFPADALQNPHPGIYDALLADLNTDGQIELYVSYWGPVGVQQVDLAKKDRRWGFRQIENVVRLAVGPSDAQGKRLLWCTHSGASLIGLDSDGQRQAELMLPNRVLYAAFAQDLTGDGQPEWCGIHFTTLDQMVIVGFDLAGKELWTYPLPKGRHEHPIEPVFVGQLVPNRPKHWIFPGPDGSIHLVGADGNRIDTFCYGEALCGLAAGMFQGQPILIVSTPKALEAWRIEPLQPLP
ncbi:MAG: redoxin domain-containing protein [Thermoguttaceae bacterium]|nr:redoxin domain-containing protein [Thermoguttaceae bacterium]MDW8037736.1 redoxin domain-containing protein [Thermoguttaceae bacterium]